MVNLPFTQRFSMVCTGILYRVKVIVMPGKAYSFIPDNYQLWFMFADSPAGFCFTFKYF